MNHSINFFRFIFTIIIAFWHFPALSKNVLNSGYIVVEFFFIISGFFLYQTYRKKDLSIIEYAKNKLSKFWFKTVLITLIIFLLNIQKNELTSSTCIMQYLVNITFLLERVIPFQENLHNLNGPIWYLCVLIYGGTLIYATIKTFTKYHKLLLLLLTFCCYCIVFKNDISLNNAWNYPLPLLRGIASMSLGCLANIIITQNFITTRLLNLLSSLSLCLSTFLLFTPNIHGIIPVICYFFILLAISNKETSMYKLLNRPIFTKLSKTSFEIFIGHMLITQIVYKIIQMTINTNISSGLNIYETVMGSIIYLISIFIFGYIYQKICNYIQTYILKYLA